MANGTKQTRRKFSAVLLTKDHIVPISRNGAPFRGRFGELNIRAMCAKCNARLPNNGNCVGALAARLAIEDFTIWYKIT